MYIKCLVLLFHSLAYFQLKAAIHAESKKLKAVGLRLYCDCGYRFNQPTVSGAAGFSKNCYKSENWNIVPNAVVTNTASNTWVRAPGTTQVTKLLAPKNSSSLKM